MCQLCVQTLTKQSAVQQQDMFRSKEKQPVLTLPVARSARVTPPHLRGPLLQATLRQSRSAARNTSWQASLHQAPAGNNGNNQ
jgi:hypothetical protein